MYSLAPITEEVSSDDGSFADEDEDDSRVSTREDVHAPVSPSMLPPPVPLFTPYPSLAVEKFMTEDDGIPIVHKDHESESKNGETADDANIPKAAASLSSTLSLTRMSSRIFTDSSSAISSVASHITRASRSFTADSITEHLTSRDDEKMFQLPEFCKLIENHASLERAKILSVECYREPIQLGVVHRTLLFHLQREGRTDVWMRVDRRRSRKVSFPVFAVRGGRTEANDVALLSGTRKGLLDRRPATLENWIEFGSPPNLGVFRFCLHVICDELLEYRVWPQNCWFMCSLLQEHLHKAGKGTFHYGGFQYLNLARGVRSRIEARVYHTVQLPPSLFEIWSSLQEDETKPRRLEVSQDLRWRYERRGSKWVASAAFMEQLRREVEATGTVASQNDTSNASSEAASGIDLALHAFLSEDQLYQSEIFAKPPRLLSAARVHRSRAIIVRAHLRSLQDAAKLATPPDRHNLVSELVRVARATSETYPATSCACLEHACAIVEWSPKIGRLWIDSQVLKGHTDEVDCVAFSPDGRQIASASDDKTIRRWDALTGSSINEPMRGHTGWVMAVAFSPDGTQIVSGSRDDALRRWDAFSGEPLDAPMRGHTKSVRSVAYSPDGKVIVSSSVDDTIRRWDASTGEAVGKPLRGHTDSVRSVVFSPDGKRIVSGADDDTVRLWDASTGEAVGEPWKGHTDRVFSVAFTPDGRLVVSGSWDDTVRRWSSSTGDSIGEPMTGHAGDVNCVAVSSDGRQIASGSNDRTIRIWDATSGELIGEPLKGHTRGVLSVAFSPDGRQIVSGSYDNSIRIWDSLEDLDRWTDSE